MNLRTRVRVERVDEPARSASELCSSDATMFCMVRWFRLATSFHAEASLLLARGYETGNPLRNSVAGPSQGRVRASP